MAAIERQKDSIRSRYATQSSRSPRQAINSAAIPAFVLGLCFAECRPVSDRELLAAQPARSQRRGRGWPPKLSGSQVRGSLFLTAPFIERVRGLTRGFTPASLAGFNRKKETAEGARLTREAGGGRAHENLFQRLRMARMSEFTVSACPW